ncbi:MAG: TonB-dependent receptor plug domain-containing protein [Longimicrobiales bacterium]
MAAVPLNALTISVEGGVPALDRVGFYERRRMGHGRFIERDDVVRRNPRRLSDLLQGMPGVRIVTDGWFSDVRLRASGLTGFNATPAMMCFPPVFLDGIVVSHGNAEPGDRYNVDSILPQDIEAIEVYTGPAQVPAKYGGANSACGIMLIWTRQ